MTTLEVVRFRLSRGKSNLSRVRQIVLQPQTSGEEGFGLSKDLITRIRWETALEVEVAQERSLILKDSFLTAQELFRCGEGWESVAEACLGCMGSSGRAQTQKVNIQQLKTGMGYPGERLVRVRRGRIKEAKILLVLTVYWRMWRGNRKFLCISATKERKTRAHWARYLLTAKGMEKSEISVPNLLWPLLGKYTPRFSRSLSLVVVPDEVQSCSQ